VPEDRRRNRVAVLGILDCRLKQRGKRQLAKALMEVAPGSGYAWHAHGEPALVWYCLKPTPAHLLRREARRRPPGAIQSIEPVPVPDQRKKISTHITTHRLYYSQYNCSSQGCIHRIASPLEDRKSGL
jgi:hypothetical protein